MSNAEIIRECPASAIPEVPIYVYGNCRWVISKTMITVNGAAYRAGNHNYEGKLQKFRNDDFLVLVAGRLYRITANDRKLCVASEERMLTDAVYDHKRDLVIACDWTKLFCYDFKA